ncbi:MAG: fused MFS/spermidine synthase [Verrucomicrobiota bacterium]
MPDQEPRAPGAASQRRLVLLAVGALGVSCVMTQLVLMRELLCALTGNELVLGVVLGNWLLLMGVGAWLGRRSDRQRDPAGSFLWMQILIAVVPVAQVFAVRVLRNQIFARGAAVGISATVGASFVVLVPYCLVAGFLLALACAIDARGGDGQASAGRVYIADSLGSILGGALFSLILAWVLNSFVALASVGFLNLALTGLLAWGWGRRRIVGAAIAGAACLALVAFELNTDAATTRLQHPGEEILFRGNSPYGQIVVTRAGEQINFFQNGAPVVSTHNTAEVEEAAEYAMAQRPDARRALLIGGGVAGTAKELLKYRAEVTCVELDPLFLELGRRFLPQNLADPRIAVVNTDGRRFVQRSRGLFDVIIVDLADPTTAQLNRFHTAEFLAEAKQALTAKGVLALAVGRYENFVSPELGRVLATAHKTLQGVFANVVMLPGGRVFFLASDGPLGMDIAGQLERAGIRTRFVNRHYLDAMLTPDRVADLQRAAAQDAAVNRDFSPVLYFRCLRLWASQFNPRFGAAEAVLALALGIYVARLRGTAVTVFASGFAASSLEVVLLLGFQALCGSLYYQLGIIVTVFMAGLAAGAAWASGLKSKTPKLLAVTSMGIAALGLLLPPVLGLLSRAPAFGGTALTVQVAIAGLTFALAVPVGAQFPLATRIEFNGTNASVSRLYTADFMGAFLGALLASTLLIPLIGVSGVCLLAAALNALAGGALILKKAVT